MNEHISWQASEIEAVLSEEFPDWITFPIFRNVYEKDRKINRYIFINKEGMPVTGTFHHEHSNRVHFFISGNWRSTAMKDVLRSRRRR